MATTRKNAQPAPPDTPLDQGGWIALRADPEERITVGFSSIQERRHVLDWLNEGLRDGRPGRLVSEYPLLFERNASAIPVTLWSHTTPIAFCMLWAVTFRVGVHRLRTGMISLVYTDPGFRGRGHASDVVQAAIDEATALELGLLLLWSDVEALYSGLDFVEAGHESLLVIDAATVERALLTERPAPSLEIGCATPSDWLEIERLRGYRTCQLEFDPGELARSRSIPDLEVRVASDATGLRGFAMRGRGDDLVEVVHEWGGDADAALLCCQALLEANEPWNELFLMTPPAQDALSWSLRQAGAHRVRKRLAWMRVASPSALAADLSSMLPGVSGLAIEVEPTAGATPVRIRLRSAHGETRLDPRSLFDALFGCAGPEDPTELARALEPCLGRAALAHLPIPLFVWGLESI
ncbi:MAG: GNAT family N-acetyltransferase [bacterium]|nr:GNAT family N-acetyltransferase [bacterium]